MIIYGISTVQRNKRQARRHRRDRSLDIFTTIHNNNDNGSFQSLTTWPPIEIPFGVRALEQGHYIKGIVPASHFQAWLKINSTTTTPQGIPLLSPIHPITSTYILDPCETSLKYLSMEDLHNPLPSLQERIQSTYNTPHPLFISKGHFSPRAMGASVQYTIKGATPARLDNTDISDIDGCLRYKDQGAAMTRWPHATLPHSDSYRVSSENSINNYRISSSSQVVNSTSTLFSLPSLYTDDNFGQILARRLEVLAADIGHHPNERNCMSDSRFTYTFPTQMLFASFYN